MAAVNPRWATVNLSFSVFSYMGDFRGEAMCTMGISAFITQTEIIVGSPGSFEWQGESLLCLNWFFSSLQGFWFLLYYFSVLQEMSTSPGWIQTMPMTPRRALYPKPKRTDTFIWVNFICHYVWNVTTDINMISVICVMMRNFSHSLHVVSLTITVKQLLLSVHRWFSADTWSQPRSQFDIRCVFCRILGHTGSSSSLWIWWNHSDRWWTLFLNLSF